VYKSCFGTNAPSAFVAEYLLRQRLLIVADENECCLNALSRVATQDLSFAVLFQNCGSTSAPASLRPHDTNGRCPDPAHSRALFALPEEAANPLLFLGRTPLRLGPAFFARELVGSGGPFIAYPGMAEKTLARVEQTLSRRVPAIAATFGRP